MADKTLFDNNNLQTLLGELKEKFPLITALATVNGETLVNGGLDIGIDAERCVLFYDGTPAMSVPASQVQSTSTANPTAIYLNNGLFIAAAGAGTSVTYHNNWPGADDYGDIVAGGRQPVKGKLYVDTKAKKFYHWDGGKLVDLTLDTTLYNIVTTLPTASAATENKIYLLASSSSATGNTKAEYITIYEGGSYKWEKLGEVGADINLADYITSTALTNRLASYYTKTQADARYLQKTDAETIYMKKDDYGYTTMTAAQVTAAVKSILG